MATLNVIYRIAADISSLESNVSKGVSTMQGMERLAGTVGTALGGMFTISAVKQFVSDTLDAADRLERLAAVTGISVEGLQDLEYVATRSGLSLETVTMAVTQMQNRMASGDASAVGALNKLGISMQDLNGLQQDQQFIKIAEAIARIEDPAIRTQLRMDLFGKSGAQVAALGPDIKKLADDFQGASARSIKVLADWGDKFDDFTSKVKARSTEMLAAILDPVAAHEEAVRKMAANDPFNAPTPPKSPFADDGPLSVPSAKAAEEAFNKLNGTLKQQAERMAKVAEAAEKAKKAAEELTRHFDRLRDSVDRGGSSLANIGRSIEGDFNNPIKAAIENAEFMEQHFRRLWDSVDHGGSSLSHIGQAFGKLDDDLVTSTKSIGTHLGELFKNVPRKMGEMQDTLATMLTEHFGGGGTMHTIMSSGLNLIFGPASGLLVSLAMQGIAAMSGVILDGLKVLGGWLKDFFSWAWDGIKAVFGATGPGAAEPTPPGYTDPNTGTDYPDYIPQGPPPTVPDTQGARGAGSIVINVHGSVLSERDLIDCVRRGLGGDLSSRYALGAA